MAEAISEADLREYLELIAALYTREAGHYASHADYIARHCAAPMAQQVMA
jgi:tryptophan halogenase